MTAGSTRSEYTELWVCFTAPPTFPSAQVLLLSFMTPSDEAIWKRRSQDGRLVNGRELALDVRAEARGIYLDLIARVGATPIEGRTLREVLKGDDGGSRWWFLKTSEKDCEWEGDFYTTLIRLMCVKRLVDRHRLTRITVHGGPPAFAEIVSRAFPTTSGGRREPYVRTLRDLCVGIASRCAFLLLSLTLWARLRTRAEGSARRFDVLLHGQWGWSVRPNPDGRLQDRYFTDLPAKLAARGLTVGWLASCDGGNTIGVARRRRPVTTALSHPEIVVLERYLTLGDIVARAFDFRYLARFWRFSASRAFQALCLVEGFDLYPVMRRQLFRLLAGPGIGRLELLALATKRACAQVTPRVLLTFLELFLQSRAIYAGARRAATPVKLWTAQHAAYGRDKLFGVVEPARELAGEPDRCAVPAPDGIFVMGALSEEIWKENGFPKDRVIVTGGLRYQHVRMASRAKTWQEGERVRVLVIGSLIVDADLDMCEAVSAAIEALPSIEVTFRDHPAFRLSEHPSFRRVGGAIRVSTGTLDDDLAASDLVVFNHSSVAEEALLRGIPAWQWLWAGVNESVFMDLPVVPRFTCVEALQNALATFLRDPESYCPRRDVQDLILTQCFGPDPAGASARVADHVVELVTRHELAEMRTP